MRLFSAAARFLQWAIVALSLRSPPRLLARHVLRLREPSEQLTVSG